MQSAIDDHNRYIDNRQNPQSAIRNRQILRLPPIGGNQLRRAGRLPPLFREQLMFERDDARLELREVSEAFGCCQTVGPFHLEDVFCRRWVESCDESRDAIAALEKPNHMLLIGPTTNSGQTAGGEIRPELFCRRRREPGGPIGLTYGFASFGDRPGLAACRTADIHDRAPERFGLRGHRVATGAGKKSTGFSGIQWPFVHDRSTMPYPRRPHNFYCCRFAFTVHLSADYELVSARDDH